MSYVKQFKDYTIKADSHHGMVWLCIDTVDKRPHKFVTVSGFAHAPTIFERLKGITWQDKLELKEKELFKEMLEKQKTLYSPTIQKEIDTFLNS